MSGAATKVLMTADTVGGVWTYALDLIRALEPRGVRFALATMGAPLSDDQRAAVATLPNVTVFDSNFRLEWMPDPWADVRAAGEWLLEIERTFRPDVVHLNGYAHAALDWAAPVLVAAHSCVLSWWQAVKREPAPAEWGRYRREVADGLAAADLVVAPTRAMLDCLVYHYGPLSDGRVIPNGRDGSAFQSPASSAKEPIVLSVGRLWDEAKNVAALERVAPKLPWPVVVAGEEKHPARDTDDGICHGANLRCLGRLAPEQLAPWFARAAVYALPARYEPFGLSALEAALNGCALVLGDIPSLREVWGDAAVYVPPDDARALAAAIDLLARTPTWRRAMAAAARRRAGAYTPQRMAGAYLAAYRELVDRGDRFADSPILHAGAVGARP